MQLYFALFWMGSGTVLHTCITGEDASPYLFEKNL